MNFQWSDPEKIHGFNGKLTTWKRFWIVPDDKKVQNEFWIYYKSNKIRLRLQGFSVRKDKSGIWFFEQTVSNSKEFKELLTSNNNEKYKDADFTKSELEKYSLKDSFNKKILLPYQIPITEQICSALKKHGSAINGSDMGTGKSYMAVALAREFNFKIGIVCPKAVISSWHRVINDEFKMSKQCVFVINYESLKTGNQKHIATWVKSSKTKKKTFTWKVPKDTLIIFDESQKIKGRDTKNAEIAIEAKKQGYKILLCSGTSAISPLELRAQGFILGLHKLSNFFPWLYEHGVSKGMYGLEFNNDETVLKKLHKDLFLDRGVRVKKEDIKDFPDCETIIDAFNLDDINTKKINQIYKDMQKELAFLKAKKKRDTSAEMVIRLRARQQAEILKVPLLVEMTEEALEEGYSVAIIVNFTDTIKALAERLNTKCIVWGDNKKTEREDNIASFQKDKDRVILVNIQAGGVGVSLHDLNGKHPRLSLISPNDSAVLLKQATGRIHRAGAKSKAIQKIVFIAGTEEEEVCKNVRSKIKNLDLINDGDLIIGKIF